MNEPMPKRGERRDPPEARMREHRAARPAHCVAKPAQPRASRMSGTRHQIHTATTSVTAASTTKIVRQST